MNLNSRIVHLSDLHVHLHGCLTALDVYKLGKDHWMSRRPALRWFADEYAAAKGQTTDPLTYWDKPDGLRRLTADFEYIHPGDFTVFQAHFNLLIALFPITPADASILKYVVDKDLLDETLSQREYRIFLPPRFTPADIWSYLDNHAKTLESLMRNASMKHKPDLSMAISLSREPELLKAQYKVLKEWQTDLLAKKDPALNRITAIDFCGDESTHAPAVLIPFMKQVQEDNKRSPATALALLLHVGEQWHGLAPEVAIQNVLDACRGGAHRLGHALAIGIDPDVLAAAGTNQRQLPATELAARQKSAREEIADRNGVIEVCPSSNRLISSVNDLAPCLAAFRQDHLQLVIGSDNPGLLATTIASEWQAATAYMARGRVNSSVDDGVEPGIDSWLRQNSSRFSSIACSGRVLIPEVCGEDP